MDRICRSLTSAGHDVVLVGRERPHSLALPDRPYRQHRIKCKHEVGKAFYLEYNWRLLRELQQWNFDVINAVDVDTLAAGAMLTRRADKLLVFDAHEWFHMTPEVVDRPLIRGFWKGLARKFAPRADLAYTVAPQLAQKLAADYGRAFHTVRNLPRRRDGATSTPTEKIILYQGMLNPGRGLEVAIAAMDQLPGCQLWLAGSGPEEGALRRCNDRLKNRDRVKFLGFIPPDELPALTERAWIGLNLLEGKAPSYYYSLANKALDYIQAGIPSVQMDFPEYRSIQEEYGCYLLLPELAATPLAQLIRSLSEDPVRYSSIRSANLLAAETLCWEREEQVLLALWASLKK